MVKAAIEMMRTAHVVDGSLALIIATDALQRMQLRDVLKSANAWQP